MKKLLIAVLLLGCVGIAKADSLSWNLPGGIGTVQLPWQSTEVLYGYVVPFNGGLSEEIAGASLPVLTLGKLKSGEGIIDGQVGAIGSWPTQGPSVSPYLAFGHNFAQDIPALSMFKSLHLNGAVTYLTNLGGWYGGGTISYSFGS